MHSPFRLVPARLVNQLHGIGRLVVRAVALAALLYVTAFLRACNGLAVNAKVCKQALVVVVDVET